MDALKTGFKSGGGKPLPSPDPKRLQIQDLTPQIAKQAGLLKSQYTNVPIGDCIIAATAMANHARILSDDPHFDAIEETKRSWI